MSETLTYNLHYDTNASEITNIDFGKYKHKNSQRGCGERWGRRLIIAKRQAMQLKSEPRVKRRTSHDSRT